MNYFETISQQDALALVALLSEACNVHKPRVDFAGRKLTRGTYWPGKQMIRVAPQTQPWIVVHEFAHYLNHLENGIDGKIVSNNHEPHSQAFYYKLRRVARLMGGDYPWHREYKQVARWAKADAAACTEGAASGSKTWRQKAHDLETENYGTEGDNK